MIKQFLAKLRELLNQYDLTNQEKQDIIDDYTQIIDDGISKGLSEEQVLNYVGKPENIIKELGLKKRVTKRKGDRIVALSPFISLILFFILGFSKGLWHPGWLVFLLIPASAIFVELVNGKPHSLVALSPFIAVGLFFFIGFAYSTWHPTWLVFLLIPVTGIISSMRTGKFITTLTALSPFISLTSFILIGHYIGYYEYAWLVFLLIPFTGELQIKNKLHRLIIIATLLLGVCTYVYITYTYGTWNLALLSFIPWLLCCGILLDVNITLGTWFDKVLIFSSIALFILVGWAFDVWAVSWLFLLLIPVGEIIRHNKNFRLTSISPFIAITLFITLGYFFGIWHLSWLAFLLIPMIAIIEN